MDKLTAIANGETYLGIELGSTRIKAVLIGKNHEPIASGGHDWENKLENGIWTYSLDDVWSGIRASYKRLCEDVREKYGAELKKIGGIGISAMMHGYLVFDREGNQLVPFRTWRNTMTEQAAGILSEKFSFNIPQRWSVAHLYQAILNGESHVKDIALITTLAGYVHWKLTGEKVLGVGEASGVFPIVPAASKDAAAHEFDAKLLSVFDGLTSAAATGWKLEDIMPRILDAGEEAGRLTEEGAALLDPSGALESGISLCPPEGDAGTGMVATNSVMERTGNVSAGTSIFAMIVLEKPLSKMYQEIDMVATPAGKPVAMVHCNNCTSDLDAWAALFREVTGLFGERAPKPALYDALYAKALEGELDCGGLVSCNYLSGEHITGFTEGRPIFVRMPESRLNLANFMRSILFSAMASLRIGMNIITVKEKIKLEKLLGHGGIFKTEGVGQRLMASALDVPVAVMKSAGEGGAWGIALLASYMMQKEKGESLELYLEKKVFANFAGTVAQPNESDRKGFEAYMEMYGKLLEVERSAVENL